MILSFGKHAGKLLSEVPTRYLLWLSQIADKIEPRLLSAIERELCRRERQHVPAIVDRCMALEIVQAGRRTLAVKHHPDRSGNLSTMQRVNQAADWLEAVLMSSGEGQP